MARTDTLGNFLTDVADAIRTKGGTSATIQASNFDTAIANLPSGGGTTEVEEKDVNFYDYEGTILHSYTKTEFLALESLPDNPTHEGLIAQGWNWTLSDAKEFVTDYGKLEIGQYFITDDGATRIYVNFYNSERLSPYLCFGLDGTATIDWGDNTTSVVTGTNISTLVKTQHTFPSAGKYVISISGDDILFKSTSSSTATSMVLTMNDTADNGIYDNVYTNSIYKIELGTNVKKLELYAFARLICLKSITMPSHQIEIPSGYVFSTTGIEFIVCPNFNTFRSYMFNDCRNLKTLSIPKVTTAGGNSMFNNCLCLKKISASFTFQSSMFYSCYSLVEVYGENQNTNYQGSNFNNCRSLVKIVYSPNATRIRTYAFANCLSLKTIDFTKCEAVPTLDNINAFDLLPADCVMIIPDSLFNTWKTANNWSNFASHMVKASEA